MAAATIHDPYARYIQGLPTRERLRLAALILEELAEEDQGAASQSSIRDLYGAGAHNPVGMDAQEYVNKLREEWDHRP